MFKGVKINVINNVMNTILYVLKNGYYIPLLHAGLYMITDDHFLSTIIAMKAYPANYFYWFCDHYSYLSNHNWVKQFIRYTDTGHIVSFLYYFYPEYLPLAFNVHYVITVAYWVGRIFIKMEDSDKLVISEIDPVFEETWSAMVHGVPLVLLTHRIINQTECVPFDYYSLKLTYGWNYSWLFGVYIPWRLYTGDCVYNILSHKSPWKKIVGFFAFIHFLVLTGNITGYLLAGC
jgi:hypothetical protein